MHCGLTWLGANACRKTCTRRLWKSPPDDLFCDHACFQFFVLVNSSCHNLVHGIFSFHFLDQSLHMVDALELCDFMSTPYPIRLARSHAHIIGLSRSLAKFACISQFIELRSGSISLCLSVWLILFWRSKHRLNFFLSQFLSKSVFGSISTPWSSLGPLVTSSWLAWGNHELIIVSREKVFLLQLYFNHLTTSQSCTYRKWCLLPILYHGSLTIGAKITWLNSDLGDLEGVGESKYLTIFWPLSLVGKGGDI